MRFRHVRMLLLISLITVGAAWISIPGDDLDIAGFKSDHPVRQGLDLQGGLQVTLEARPPGGGSVDSGTLDGTRDTLERRVNGLGVSEPLIQTRGDNQIVVELPGVEDPEQAVEVLRETALLEIINTNGSPLAPGTVVQTTLGDTSASAAATPAVAADGSVQAPPDPNVPTPDPSSPVYETIVSGSDLSDSFVTSDPMTGQPLVAFELKGSASETFYEFTRDHIGQPMSIVVDKQVISSPNIAAAISSSGTIDGMTVIEAEQLATQLKAGALGVPLDVVSSRTVGPSLGADSIDRSLIAGIVGLATVAAFMILYYRLPGVLSVVALLIYTAITFALFRLIPVTLTLPGIAGFILSIGMAVDANVLIFARMKEELRSGRSLRDAVEAGFDHAWPSIRDSNVSTMITCVILYWFGQFTGATIITGFALTLFVGVAVSLFSAITVTRTLLRLLVDLGAIRNGWLLGLERSETSAPVTT
ncbi:MAG TPA: protein translocase subunit SecD [Thermomicrobiales bacterium]|nr:protein translocase subunit SecD [Thermomicrobiales bacterium]